MNENIYESLLEFDIKKAAVLSALGLASMAGSADAYSPADNAPSSYQQKEEVVVDMDKIVQIESSGNPKAVNKHTGARGLCQIMKPTWIECCKKMGVDWSWDDAFDAEKNLAVGTFYMNKEIPRMIKVYKLKDDIAGRLTSYNYGIGHYKKLYRKHGKKYIEHLPKETQDYIKKYFR